jgi:predicted HD phosphohydrolase
MGNKSKSALRVILLHDLDFIIAAYTHRRAEETLRKQMHTEPAHFVLSTWGDWYWYMDAEMMAFFQACSRLYPDARFLFITGEDPGSSSARPQSLC